MSLVQLVRESPVLRETALNIALVFAAFNAIWVTLVFRLESPPYNISSYFMQNRVHRVNLSNLFYLAREGININGTSV
jgi:hypothetical protein